MPPYDLLITNGELIAPETGFRGRADLGIRGGRIVAREPSLPPADTARVVDAGGCYVVPGLVDMHTHLGFELHARVIDPNVVCPPAGVTTAVDMGSTGAFTFPWYRERVLKTSTIRLCPFINIASLGTISIHNPYYVENYGRYIDVDDTVATIEENRGLVRGIKVFATGDMVGEWVLPALEAGRRVARATGLPLAVHISKQPPRLSQILDTLEPGDIITHTYTPHTQGILDEGGRVRAEVWEARQRGILFDIGHGAGSFAFAVARRALDQDFWPDTISTDLYYANIESPVVDLPTTLSKFLALGLSLEEVITRATQAPATALRLDQLGALTVGSRADIALLRLRQGRFVFVDTVGETLAGDSKLDCAMTIMDGEVIYEEQEKEA